MLTGASDRLRALLAAAGGVVLVVAAVHGLDHARRGAQGDFLNLYLTATAAVQGEDIYAAGSRGYVYPPFLAFLIEPIAWLGFLEASVLWTVLTLALIPLCLVLALREIARRLDVTPTPTTLLAAGGFTLIVLGDKFAQELRQGNCNLFLVLASVLALTWLGRRPLLCGTVLGFAIAIKYLPIVFLPYLAVRRRYRELAAAIAAAVAFSLLPALSFGWSRTLDYLAVAGLGLGSLTRSLPAAADVADVRPLTWSWSVSIPSTLARLLQALGASPSLAIPLTAMVAGMLLAAAWYLYARAGLPLFATRTPAADDATAHGRALVALEWAGLTAAAVLFSPQTTPRHQNLTLFLVALAGALVLFPRRDPLRRPVVIGLVVFFLTLVLPPGLRIQAFRDAVEAWRVVGGMSWGLLVLTFTTVHVGLREVVALRAQAGAVPGAHPSGPGRLAPAGGLVYSGDTVQAGRTRKDPPG